MIETALVKKLRFFLVVVGQASHARKPNLQHWDDRTADLQCRQSVWRGQTRGRKKECPWLDLVEICTAHRIGLAGSEEKEKEILGSSGTKGRECSKRKKEEEKQVGSELKVS